MFSDLCPTPTRLLFVINFRPCAGSLSLFPILSYLCLISFPTLVGYSDSPVTLIQAVLPERNNNTYAVGLNWGYGTSGLPMLMFVQGTPPTAVLDDVEDERNCLPTGKR